MRKDEGEQVVRLFRDSYNIPLIHSEPGAVPEGAGRRQRSRDQGKTIGSLFIDVFEKEAGTIGACAVPGARGGRALSRRDRTVSFTGGPSVTIKSHHNVGMPAAAAHEHEAGRCRCASCSATMRGRRPLFSACCPTW